MKRRRILLLLAPAAVVAGLWPRGVALTASNASYLLETTRLVAKSHFRNGGANLPVCRGAQQGAAHHFGNDFWQSL